MRVENGRAVALVVTLSYKSMQYNKKNAKKLQNNY